MTETSEGRRSKPARGARRKTFVERTLARLLGEAARAAEAEGFAARDGLLQRLDPRVKIVGVFALLLSGLLSARFEVLGSLFALALALAVLSRLSLATLARRGWLAAFLFTGPLALPAIFLTAGDVVFRLPVLGLPVTAQGVRAAGFLLARAELAVTLTLLVMLSTRWTNVLKALRVLGVPAVLVVILGMTYRYVFLMLQTAHDMFEARQSRLVGALEPADRRRLAASSVGVLLGKSLHLSDEVHLAMLARGFRGDVATLEDFRMRAADWAALAAFALVAAFAVWFGR